MSYLEWGALGGRTECCVYHELKRREEVLEILVVQIREFPNHRSKSLIDSFADGVASWIMPARDDLVDVQVFSNLSHNSLHQLWSIIRAKFIRHSTRENDALHDRLAHAFHLTIGEKFQHGFS